MLYEDLEYGRWTFPGSYFCNAEEAKKNDMFCSRCKKNFEIMELVWEGEFNGTCNTDYYCQECFGKEKQDLIDYIKELGEDRRAFGHPSNVLDIEVTNLEDIPDGEFI